MNRDLQGLWIARLARDPLLVSGLLLPVWCVGARTRFLMTHCTIPTLVNVFAGNLFICLIYIYISFLADWSTEGCEIIMKDAETMTCACNHLTAFSILQVHTPHTHARTHTHTHTHVRTHTYIHTCTLIICAVWCNLFISTPVQSPADPILSNQVILVLMITLSVVGGAVFLVLAVTGVAYLIWRYVTVHGGNTQHRTCSNTYTHTHTHTHTRTHTAHTFTTSFLHEISTQDSPQAHQRQTSMLVKYT